MVGLLEAVVNLIEDGSLTPRRAEILVGHLMVEWALDAAQGPSVATLGASVRLKPQSLGRSPATWYRLRQQLSELGLPVELPLPPRERAVRLPARGSVS